MSDVIFMTFIMYFNFVMIIALVANIYIKIEKCIWDKFDVAYFA